MSTPLTFTISEGFDDDSESLIQYGAFSRDWADEEALDELMDRADSGAISVKQALLHAQKLLAKSPDNLELQNYLANRMWDLEMRDEAAEVWAKGVKQASRLIPKGFKGLIPWLETDNRSFLRLCHGHLLGLMHQLDGKAAQLLAKKMLAWNPNDNTGVRMLMGDISLMQGDSKAALKSFLKEADSSPAHWYQAGQIAFRDGDFVSACTYLRRGIAANPYIAEGLTGRTVLTEHLYWHASSIYGPEWAADYLNAPQSKGICEWTPEEVDFADWVFNTAEVLKERAKVASLHEGLTYARAPEERQLYGHKSRLFLNNLTDTLSKKLVRKILNRYGIEIWPWDRAGFINATPRPASTP
jgi:tetratricopeptide (TPR) repeat protein